MRDFSDKIERSSRGAIWLYPWRLMTCPGDAFVAKTGSARAFSATASKLKREDGRCFAVRRVNHGTRVTLIDVPENITSA